MNGRNSAIAILSKSGQAARIPAPHTLFYLAWVTGLNPTIGPVPAGSPPVRTPFMSRRSELSRVLTAARGLDTLIESALGKQRNGNSFFFQLVDDPGDGSVEAN